jgi:transposase
MLTEERKPTSSGQQKSGKSNTWQQRQGGEGNKKGTSGIPILRYRKGKHFYRFKQTLSKVSLREFGNLGKLIQKGTYFQPEYVPPSVLDNITSINPKCYDLDLDKIGQILQKIWPRQ